MAQHMLLKIYMPSSARSSIYIRVRISVNMQNVEPWELSEADIQETIFTQRSRVRSEKGAIMQV